MAASAEAMRDRIGNTQIDPGDTMRTSDAAAGRHGTRTDYPRDMSIPDLFEEQAALAPEAVALEFEDRRVSYGALNEQANRIARRLQNQGVERGTLVGLCVERSPELIVGLLAILKAGGAYVPLDPEYPDSRLRYMIGDTSTPVIVADRRGSGRLAPRGATPGFSRSSWMTPRRTLRAPRTSRARSGPTTWPT